MHLRSKEGVFIHQSVWPKYEGEYTIPNGKRTQAVKMQQVWALQPYTIRNGMKIPNKHYIPETIKCFKKEGEWIKVPNGITAHHPSLFISDYANPTAPHFPLSRESYDYQSNKLDELLYRNTGLLHASTGSGKTQMICDIISRLHRKTLVVVQNLTQMQQMVDDIRSILELTPLQVSGKKMTKKELASANEWVTVCSIDSRDKINTEDYGLILLDEADCYLGSDDRREWVGSLSPEYMYALTGTVKINNVSDDVFRLYYGPTTRLEMLHLTPDYDQVLSDFEYTLEDIKDFHELKAALYADSNRDKLILGTVKRAIREGHKKGIVFTEHIDHAKGLCAALESMGIKSFLLIGEVSKDDRERIRQEAKNCNGSAVIVGSVKIIGRGFDLPELSFGVLTTCEKFQSNIEQYIGRIIRKFEGKKNPVFYDIVDHMQPLLNNQAKSRVATFKKTFQDGKVSIS